MTPRRDHLAGQRAAGMYDRIPSDEALTDWRTNPRLCLKLAFLKAHAVMLLARRKLR